MLIRTHLTIAAFFVLLLLPVVEHKIIFSSFVLISSFMPDIDSRFSVAGRPKIARILQFFTKHRGITHSFTFLIFTTLLFVLFFPIIALPFFLGYGLHLLADSFTLAGIKPFYPYRKITKGKIKTGGKSEIIILSFFIIADLLLLIREISSI